MRSIVNGDGPDGDERPDDKVTEAAFWAASGLSGGRDNQQRQAGMSTADMPPASVLVHLADALSVPDGGFSVSALNWRDARVGYAVSVFPECEEQIAGPVVRTRIAQYLAAHAPLLARPDVVLGGWRSPDDDVAYLDVSIVVRTRELALALAQENGQAAVWDFAACRSIPLVGASVMDDAFVGSPYSETPLEEDACVAD